jgi:hypothetical protein
VSIYHAACVLGDTQDHPLAASLLKLRGVSQETTPRRLGWLVFAPHEALGLA